MQQWGSVWGAWCGMQQWGSGCGAGPGKPQRLLPASLEPTPGSDAGVHSRSRPWEGSGSPLPCAAGAPPVVSGQCRSLALREPRPGEPLSSPLEPALCHRPCRRRDAQVGPHADPRARCRRGSLPGGRCGRCLPGDLPGEASASSRVLWVPAALAAAANGAAHPHGSLQPRPLPGRAASSPHPAVDPAACPGSRSPGRGFPHGDVRLSLPSCFWVVVALSVRDGARREDPEGVAWTAGPGGFHGGKWIQIRPGSPSAPCTLLRVRACHGSEAQRVVAACSGCWELLGCQTGFSAHVEASSHWSHALGEMVRDENVLPEVSRGRERRA